MENNNHTHQPKWEDLMSMPDYVKHCGRSRRAVYNWLEEGRLKKVIIHGKIFIDKTSYIPSKSEKKASETTPTT